MTKIKVDRTKLLEAVKARQKHERESYARQRDAYDGLVLIHQERVIGALRKALQRAESGKLPEQAYRGLTVPFQASPPAKPRSDTSGLKRLVQTLEMASEDSILINADDAAEYLG